MGMCRTLLDGLPGDWARCCWLCCGVMSTRDTNLCPWPGTDCCWPWPCCCCCCCCWRFSGGADIERWPRSLFSGLVSMLRRRCCWPISTVLRRPYCGIADDDVRSGSPPLCELTALAPLAALLPLAWLRASSSTWCCWPDCWCCCPSLALPPESRRRWRRSRSREPPNGQGGPRRCSASSGCRVARSSRCARMPSPRRRSNTSVSSSNGKPCNGRNCVKLRIDV